MLRMKITELIGRRSVGCGTQKIFGGIYYKNFINKEEPFRKIKIIKRGVNHIAMNPTEAYVGPNPISFLKKKDLIDMLPLINTVSQFL